MIIGAFRNKLFWIELFTMIGLSLILWLGINVILWIGFDTVISETVIDSARFYCCFALGVIPILMAVPKLDEGFFALRNVVLDLFICWIALAIMIFIDGWLPIFLDNRKGWFFSAAQQSLALVMFISLPLAAFIWVVRFSTAEIMKYVNGALELKGR